MFILEEKTSAGGITGVNNSIVEKCCNTGEIYASEGNVGGIAGYGMHCTKFCYNMGYVHGNSTAGGIIGYKSVGNVYNCYNKGKVQASKLVGGINGAAGSKGRTVYTYNCYNLGTITGSTSGQITGWNNANSGSSRNINCYSTNATKELLNAGAYSNNEWIDDVKIKDTEIGEETWKYNNGYPILKWQLEN